MLVVSPLHKKINRKACKEGAEVAKSLKITEMFAVSLFKNHQSLINIR
jgi:hypothetical protein